MSRRPDEQFTSSDIVPPEAAAERNSKSKGEEDSSWEDEHRSEKRSKRSSSRDRKRRHHKDRSNSRDRVDGKNNRREEGKGSSKKGDKTRGSSTSEPGYAAGRGLDRAAEVSVHGSGSFSAQVGSAGFSQFPGQYSAPLPGPQIPLPHYGDPSAHVADQFPGQNPTGFTAPYRPPLPMHGGFGAAAEFYGDQGESVQNQPGVRPQPPSIIVGTEPHLMAALATPAPPVETGHGSASDFYGSVSGTTQGPPSSQLSTPGKSPRVSQAGSSSSKPSKSSKVSAPAALVGGTALGYAAIDAAHSSSSNTQFPSALGNSTPYNQQASNKPIASSASYVTALTSGSHHGHAASEPILPTMNTYSPASSNLPLRPGKQSSHSNVPLYAAGAAGLAAGAYGLHEYHEQHHEQQNHQIHNRLHDPNGSPTGATMYPDSYANPSTIMKQQHRGPISKFVDWWKDYEDVRRMEEYTEYIGVCKECFDPRTSPRDAPRKHHYHGSRSSETLRRRSSDSLRRSHELGGRHGRVDKESRYYSSENESRRRKKSSWLASGLAGYGLINATRSILGRNNDFDDTYSVKNGRDARLRTSVSGRNRSRSVDRSHTSRGVIRQRSRSAERIATAVTRNGKVVKQVLRRRSKSRSPSKKREPGLIGAAATATFGELVAGHSHPKHRNRSNSPRRAFVRKSRNQESDPSTVWTTGSSRISSHRGTYRSSNFPVVDTSHSNRPRSRGLFDGFFAAPPGKKQREHQKKQTGFFNFGDSSSSSAGSALAYGNDPERRHRISQKRPKKTSRDDLNATLLGIGATAAALSAANTRRGKRSKRSPELVAIRKSACDHGQWRRHQDGRSASVSSPSSSDDEAWESAPEDEDSSSVSSGLAFGDFDYNGRKPVRRQSQESLGSQSSGTGKWGWRWGSKRARKSHSPTKLEVRTQLNSADGPACTESAGAAVGGAYPFHNESAMSSVSNMPSMQHVYPIPTSDPNSFDTSRRSPSITSSQPPSAMTSRPAPVPIQQPQPIAPIFTTVYTGHGPYRPTYTAPTGPPVFSNAPMMPFLPTQDTRLRDELADGRPSILSRRGRSSPTISTFAHDAVVAGIAAGATASILSSSGKKRNSSPGSPTGVRFELTKDQAKKEDRSERKERRRRERDGESRTEKAQENEEEQHRIENGEAEKSLRKRPEAALREETDETVRERQVTVENERKTQPERRETEWTAGVERPRARDRVAYEDERKPEFERQQEQNRQRAEREQNNIEERRRQREAELEAGIGSQRRDLEDCQRREGPSDAWTAPVAAGIAGATVGAILVGHEHHINSGGDYQARAVEPSNEHAEPLYDDDIFDPDFFKRSRSKSDATHREDVARQAASKVIADMEQRYSEPQPSQADFFAPPELLKKSQGKTAVANANGNNDIQVYRTAHDFDDSLSRGAPYPLAYAFAATKGGVEPRRPWGVPILNVIAPTPPVSNAGSVRGDKSAPPSPLVRPSDASGLSREPEEKSTTSKVTWGDDQTRIYDVEIPESHHEQYIPKQELNHSARDHDDQITVKVESPSLESSKTTSYKFADLPTVGIDVYGPHILESFGQMDAKHAGPRTFYQSSFYETVTDVGSGLDTPGTEGAPPVRGFVEGEIDEPTPVEEKDTAVQGGFAEGDASESAGNERRRSKKEKKKREKSVQRRVSDGDVPLTTPAPQETIAEPQEVGVTPSKEDKKKRKNAAQQSWAKDDSGPSILTPGEAVPLENFELPLSKKEKAKHEKTAQRQTYEDDSSTSSPVANEIAIEPDEFQVLLSRKEKKKRDKALERQAPSADVVHAYSEPATSPTEAIIGEPESEPYERSKTSNNSKGKNDGRDTTERDLRDDNGSSSPSSAQAPGSRLESASIRPSMPGDWVSSDDFPTHESNDARKGHAYVELEGETMVSIPSNASDDVEELTEAKKPKKRGKKRSSGRFSSPTPGSPLRTEVPLDDYVGARVPKNDGGSPSIHISAAGVPLSQSEVDVSERHPSDRDRAELEERYSENNALESMEAGVVAAADIGSEFDDFEATRKANSKKSKQLKEDEGAARSQRQAFETPLPKTPLDEPTNGSMEATFDDFEVPDKSKSKLKTKKSRNRSYQDIESYEALDHDVTQLSAEVPADEFCGSPQDVLEATFEDFELPKKSRQKSRSSKKDGSDVSPVVADELVVLPSIDHYEDTKISHEGGSSLSGSGDGHLDRYVRSVASAPIEDDCGDRKKSKHRKSRRESDRHEPLDRDTRSVAASDPADLYESSRKSKKKSKKDRSNDNDTASVTSSPATEYEIDTPMAKKGKSVGVLGLFSRKSSDGAANKGARSEPPFDDLDNGEQELKEKKKKKKHGSPGPNERDNASIAAESTNNPSENRSRYADGAYDSQSQWSERKHKHERRSRQGSGDEAGIDTQHPATKVDRPFHSPHPEFGNELQLNTLEDRDTGDSAKSASNDRDVSFLDERVEDLPPLPVSPPHSSSLAAEEHNIQDLADSLVSELEPRLEPELNMNEDPSAASSQGDQVFGFLPQLGALEVASPPSLRHAEQEEVHLSSLSRNRPPTSDTGSRTSNSSLGVSSPDAKSRSMNASIGDHQITLQTLPAEELTEQRPSEPALALHSSSDNSPPTTSERGSDDVPRLLALSGPGSPDTLGDVPQRPLVHTRAASSTAVPLRFRRPPLSPGVPREHSVSFSSPIGISPSSPASATRSRQNRPGSTEFKHSTEFRPLYLVERNRKTPEIEEMLPSLPPSRETSRASSTHGSDEFQSALQSPAVSEHGEDPFIAIADPMVGDRGLEGEDILDSQQTTPKASEFPPDIMSVPDYDNADTSRLTHLERRSAISLPRVAQGEAVSPPSLTSYFDPYVDDTQLAQLPSELSRLPVSPTSRPSSPYDDALPSASDSMNNVAAAAIVGAAAGLTRHETSSKSHEPLSEDVWDSDRDRTEYICEKEHDAPSVNEESTPAGVPVRPPLSRSGSSKKGKKGVKEMKLGRVSISESSTPLSPQELKVTQQQDAQDAVDSWFEPAPPAKDVTKREKKDKKGKKSRGVSFSAAAGPPLESTAVGEEIETGSFDTETAGVGEDVALRAPDAAFEPRSAIATESPTLLASRDEIKESPGDLGPKTASLNQPAIGEQHHDTHVTEKRTPKTHEIEREADLAPATDESVSIAKEPKGKGKKKKKHKESSRVWETSEPANGAATSVEAISDVPASRRSMQNSTVEDASAVPLPSTPPDKSTFSEDDISTRSTDPQPDAGFQMSKPKKGKNKEKRYSDTWVDEATEPVSSAFENRQTTVSTKTTRDTLEADSVSSTFDASSSQHAELESPLDTQNTNVMQVLPQEEKLAEESSTMRAAEHKSEDDVFQPSMTRKKSKKGKKRQPVDFWSDEPAADLAQKALEPQIADFQERSGLGERVSEETEASIARQDSDTQLKPRAVINTTHEDGEDHPIEIESSTRTGFDLVPSTSVPHGVYQLHGNRVQDIARMPIEDDAVVKGLVAHGGGLQSEIDNTLEPDQGYFASSKKKKSKGKKKQQQQEFWAEPAAQTSTPREVEPAIENSTGNDATDGSPVADPGSEPTAASNTLYYEAPIPNELDEGRTLVRKKPKGKKSEKSMSWVHEDEPSTKEALVAPVGASPFGEHEPESWPEAEFSVHSKRSKKAKKSKNNVRAEAESQIQELLTSDQPTALVESVDTAIQAEASKSLTLPEAIPLPEGDDGLLDPDRASPVVGFNAGPSSAAHAENEQVISEPCDEPCGLDDTGLPKESLHDCSNKPSPAGEISPEKDSLPAADDANIGSGEQDRNQGLDLDELPPTEDVRGEREAHRHQDVPSAPTHSTGSERTLTRLHSTTQSPDDSAIPYALAADTRPHREQSKAAVEPSFIEDETEGDEAAGSSWFSWLPGTKKKTKKGKTKLPMPRSPEVESTNGRSAEEVAAELNTRDEHTPVTEYNLEPGAGADEGQNVFPREAPAEAQPTFSKLEAPDPEMDDDFWTPNKKAKNGTIPREPGPKTAQSEIASVNDTSLHAVNDSPVDDTTAESVNVAENFALSPANEGELNQILREQGELVTESSKHEDLVEYTSSRNNRKTKKDKKAAPVDLPNPQDFPGARDVQPTNRDELADQEEEFGPLEIRPTRGVEQVTDLSFDALPAVPESEDADTFWGPALRKKKGKKSKKLKSAPISATPTLETRLEPERPIEPTIGSGFLEDDTLADRDASLPLKSPENAAERPSQDETDNLWDSTTAKKKRDKKSKKAKQRSDFSTPLAGIEPGGYEQNRSMATIDLVAPDAPDDLLEDAERALEHQHRLAEPSNEDNKDNYWASASSKRSGKSKKGRVRSTPSTPPPEVKDQLPAVERAVVMQGEPGTLQEFSVKKSKKDKKGKKAGKATYAWEATNVEPSELDQPSSTLACPPSEGLASYESDLPVSNVANEVGLSHYEGQQSDDIAESLAKPSGQLTRNGDLQAPADRPHPYIETSVAEGDEEVIVPHHPFDGRDVEAVGANSKTVVAEQTRSVATSPTASVGGETDSSEGFSMAKRTKKDKKKDKKKAKQARKVFEDDTIQTGTPLRKGLMEPESFFRDRQESLKSTHIESASDVDRNNSEDVDLSAGFFPSKTSKMARSKKKARESTSISDDEHVPTRESVVDVTQDLATEGDRQLTGASEGRSEVDVLPLEGEGGGILGPELEVHSLTKSKKDKKKPHKSKTATLESPGVAEPFVEPCVATSIDNAEYGSTEQLSVSENNLEADEPTLEMGESRLVEPKADQYSTTRSKKDKKKSKKSKATLYDFSAATDSTAEQLIVSGVDDSVEGPDLPTFISDGPTAGEFQSPPFLSSIDGQSAYEDVRDHDHHGNMQGHTLEDDMIAEASAIPLPPEYKTLQETPTHSKYAAGGDGIDEIQRDLATTGPTVEPTGDIDFAATLAAGLEESGFNPNLVINDPIFHRRASPPGATTIDDPEEVFTTTLKRNKKGSVGGEHENSTLQEPGPNPDTSLEASENDTGRTHPGEEAEFAAALVAGLHRSGFDPSIVLDDPTFARSSPTAGQAEVEPDEFFTTQIRKKKGKKGKKGQSATPEIVSGSATPAIHQSVVRSTRDTNADYNPEIPSGQTASVESEQLTLPAKKNKKTKKAKMFDWYHSGIEPENATEDGLGSASANEVHILDDTLLKESNIGAVPVHDEWNQPTKKGSLHANEGGPQDASFDRWPLSPQTSPHAESDQTLPQHELHEIEQTPAMQESSLSQVEEQEAEDELAFTGKKKNKNGKKATKKGLVTTETGTASPGLDVEASISTPSENNTDAPEAARELLSCTGDDLTPAESAKVVQQQPDSAEYSLAPGKKGEKRKKSKKNQLQLWEVLGDDETHQLAEALQTDVVLGTGTLGADDMTTQGDLQGPDKVKDDTVIFDDVQTDRRSLNHSLPNDPLAAVCDHQQSVPGEPPAAAFVDNDHEKEPERLPKDNLLPSNNERKKSKKAKKQQAIEERSRAASPSSLQASDNPRAASFAMAETSVGTPNTNTALMPIDAYVQAIQLDDDNSSPGLSISIKKGKKSKKSSQPPSPAAEREPIEFYAVETQLAGGVQAPGREETLMPELQSGLPQELKGVLDLPAASNPLTSLMALPHDKSSHQDHGSPQRAQNKLATLFPGLQRVKRRAPSIHTIDTRPSDGSFHNQGDDTRMLHTSEVSQSLPTAITGQPPHDVSGSSNAPAAGLEHQQEVPNAMRYPSANRGILFAPEPTWDFPPNRDSGLQIPDSPMLSHSVPVHEYVRDSGYQDSTRSPVVPWSSAEGSRLATPDNEVSKGRDLRYESPRLTDTDSSSAGPLRVSVQVNPDWGFSVSGQQPPKDNVQAGMTRSVEATPQSQGNTIQQDRTPGTETSEAIASPSPIKSTTKDRAPHLFQSPPSTKQTLRGLVGSTPKEEVGMGFVTEPIRVRQMEAVEEDHGPQYLSENFHARLNPISEYSPEGSPLNKKGRAVSDVGSPEHGVKAARRTSTPVQSFRDRMRSSQGVSARPLGDQDVHFAFRAKSPLSPDGLTTRPSWRSVDEGQDTVGIVRTLSLDRSKQEAHEQRPSSVQSNQSGGSISRFKAPEQFRSLSMISNRSATPPLRRVDRSLSGDLRAASKYGQAKENGAKPSLKSISIEPPLGGTSNNKQAEHNTPQARDMANVYVSNADAAVDARSIAVVSDSMVLQEGWGDVQGSPRSPTRPPSMRKRQSMQVLELEQRLDRLTSENCMLQGAKDKARQDSQTASYQRDVDGPSLHEAVEARDLMIREKDSEIQKIRVILESLQQEIARLNEHNGQLTEANRNLSADTNERYATLQAEHAQVHDQWQQSSRELEILRQRHGDLSTGMEELVRQEIANALEEKNAEIRRLREELDIATEQIRALQRQILAAKSDDFLSSRDEDYFDSACQKLCQHVQQWLLRFSKFSDNRACRLSSEIADEKIEARLDNAILDGSDVDMLLADRTKRRDVFMSVVMTMVWEYVFTRYLFGMDREQRQKLKALEKILLEVGPQRAVAQWRATTLTLLARRQAFQSQRAQDTEAVVQEIYQTLVVLLPPPSHLEHQVQDSLRNVMRLAVDLSIEMRTQRPEYIMLPPLQPEYDTNGDLVSKVLFNASLMNERSGETTSNSDLEAARAVVKIVLFPLVVKKGNDNGEGEDEIVVCPAQVLVAKPNKDRKVVRVMSGAMEIGSPNRSRQSLVPSTMDMSNVI